jgi:hypothetical protein
VHQVEAALKAFKEIASDHADQCGHLGGPQRAQVNLKLTDVHVTHRRSQQEMETVIRERLPRSPASACRSATARSSSPSWAATRPSSTPSRTA